MRYSPSALHLKVSIKQRVFISKHESSVNVNVLARLGRTQDTLLTFQFPFSSIIRRLWHPWVLLLSQGWRHTFCVCLCITHIQGLEWRAKCPGQEVRWLNWQQMAAGLHLINVENRASKRERERERGRQCVGAVSCWSICSWHNIDEEHYHPPVRPDRHIKSAKVYPHSHTMHLHRNTFIC